MFRLSIFLSSLLLLLVTNQSLSTLADTTALPFVVKPIEQNIFQTSNLWGVGGYGGLMSGIGLSCRYHPIGRVGFQLTAGAIKFDDLMYDFGLEAQFDFDSQGRTRFYGYIGGGFYNYTKQDSGKAKENRLKAPGRLGLGIAYEWAVSEKLVFNANLAFTYFTNGDILPLPQIGIYYYFN